MSTYINTISLPTISANEIVPMTVTVEELTTATGNTIVTAKRFDTTNINDTGTDISSEVSITTNVVALANIWTNLDTPAAGSYRIQVISESADLTQKVEFNGLITVV